MPVVHVDHLLRRIARSEGAITFLSSLEVYSFTLKCLSLLSLLHKEGKSNVVVKHDTDQIKTYLIFFMQKMMVQENAKYFTTVTQFSQKNMN